MKKIVALMLALTLTLGVTTAFAWTCPNCNLEMSGKFCSECGAKKPENVCPACGYDYGDTSPKFCPECGTRLAAEATAAPTVEPAAERTAEPATEPESVRFTSFRDNENGTVTASWTGGTPPYSLRYLEVRSDDYFADQEDMTTLGQWTAATDWEFTSYRYLRLVPGKQYWLVVVDSTGMGRYQLYTPEALETLEGYNTSLEVTPMEEKGGSTSELAYLPKDTAGLDDDVTHGAKIHLSYSNPGEDEEAVLQLVYTLPNGAARVDWVGEVTLYSGDNHWVGWDFYDMEDQLQALRDYYGELPEGEVTLSVYINGKLAAEAALPCYTSDQLKITGMASQGNGTYLLSWTDNGNGPYNVYFIQRFSDNMAADRQDSRGTGRWRVWSNLDDTSAMMQYLIPGVQYWIQVTDSLGNSGVYAFDAPLEETTSSFVLKTHLPRLMVNNEYQEVASFSAATLSTGDVECGFFLELDYESPAQETAVQTLWTITLPTGEVFATDAFEDTLYVSGSSYWDCFRIGWALRKGLDWFGEIPQGEYRFDLYVNGQYADGFPFYVTE